MGNGAKEDQNQDMYGALEKNKKQVKGSIKKKSKCKLFPNWP